MNTNRSNTSRIRKAAATALLAAAVAGTTAATTTHDAHHAAAGKVVRVTTAAGSFTGIAHHDGDPLTAPPSAAYAAHATATSVSPKSGYTFELSKKTADPVTGLNVYVAANSPARATLTRWVKWVINDQRKLGVRIRYAGTLSAKTAQPINSELVSRNNACTTNLLGMTNYLYYSSVDGTAYQTMSTSQVHICAAAFHTTKLLRATVLHEMGHAIGLGHNPGIYKGHAQIMNPYVQSQDSNYQAGDLAGIHTIVTNTNRLAKITAATN